MPALFGNLLRRAGRALARLYYPVIEVSGRERIPKSGPVLFCANHPNSLMDPIVIGIATGRPVRYLAKAPLFDVPVLGPLMRALGMLPAFRASDDSSQVARNADSLAAGADILLQGEALGIFPEGKTHDAAKLEMVRSGAARIAMQAVEKGCKGLMVVPLGINFQRKEQFRSAVWVRVGEPIEASRWLAEHEMDITKATRQMTAELGRRLKDVVVHLDEEKWEPFLGDLEVLLPPAPLSPGGRGVGGEGAALRQRKRIADAMNYFLAGDRPRAEAMAEGIVLHRRKAADAGLPLHSPMLQLRGWPLCERMLSSPLGLLLLLGPAIAGTVQHLLPFALTRAIASKLQTPGRMTVSLARLALGLPIYAVWYAFVAWAMAQYFRPWVVWTWLLPMPFAGLVALGYWPKAGETFSLWWSQFRLAFRRAELNALRGEHLALRKRLQDMAEDFARAVPSRLESPAPQTKTRLWRVAGWAAAVTSAALLAIAVQSWEFDPLPELQGIKPNWGTTPVPVLDAKLDADEKALKEILAGLDDLEAKATAVREDFAAGKRSYLKQEDNDAVRKLLLRYLNYRAALLRMCWRYQEPASVKDERLRLRAFLCGYTAAASLYEASLKLVTKFDRSAETVQKLNEAEPVWNIPPGVYDTIRANMASSDNHARLEQAHGRYKRLEKDYERLGLNDAEPYASFHAAIRRSAETSGELAKELWKEKLSISARRTKKLAVGVYYNAQSMIATWIGDTKIRAPRKGQTLISKKMLEEFQATLKPGDVLLERRNWFLSNAFLPGYWPHAAMYVGTAEQLKELGLDKDPRVAKHWDAFSALDEEGHPHVIIEALSEGIVHASMEHSIGGADCAAALRPRLPPERIREAICLAFSHLGKPYDFEFDFFSTDKIVCTELCYRCYDGPIQFPIVDVLGTRTMPAIEIVRKFNAERGQPNQQLDFVSFLDGDEKTGKAKFADEDAFAGTLHRPALTWLQGLGIEKK